MRRLHLQVLVTLGFVIAMGIVVDTSFADPDKLDEPIETRYLSNIRQVTRGFEKAGEGYFSPDGKTIIYQAIRAEYPFYQIYTQPLSGGQPKLISTGRGRTTCSYFSPDGTKILFASSHLDPQIEKTEAAALKQAEEDRKSGRRRRYQWDFDPYMEIFEADLNGKILRRLTNAAGYDAEGAYSHDGKQIAFCSSRDGDADIYVMNSDGSDSCDRQRRQERSRLDQQQRRQLGTVLASYRTIHYLVWCGSFSSQCPPQLRPVADALPSCRRQIPRKRRASCHGFFWSGRLTSFFARWQKTDVDQHPRRIAQEPTVHCRF